MIRARLIELPLLALALALWFAAPGDVVTWESAVSLLLIWALIIKHPEPLRGAK